EVDRLRRRELRRHYQVALVLAVFAVADDDHLAAADLFDRLLDRGEGGIGGLVGGLRGGHAFSFPANGDSSRSTYLATTSTSTFQASPGAASPRLVRSSVSGISETSTQVSPRAATVRLTPFRATEPLSTT